MRELLGNPGRAEELGRAGYERVQKHFTWAKAAEKTTAVYREVLDDHR
jgi:starch synthase